MAPRNCATLMTESMSSSSRPPVAILEDAGWLELEAVAGLKVWQVMFATAAGLAVFVVFLCCCIRFRIPRTKEEIEADYVRKKIARKFRRQLRLIRNSDMDEMDLKRALDRVRAEFKSDTESLAQSEALSVASLSSARSATYRKASDLLMGMSLELDQLPSEFRSGGRAPLGTRIGAIVEAALATLRIRKRRDLHTVCPTPASLPPPKNEKC